MKQFIIQNLEWVLTLAFIAGGGWYTLRSIQKQLEKNQKFMEIHFDKLDKKDDSHDNEINELKITVARHEEKLSILDELNRMVRDIWKRTFDDKK